MLALATVHHAMSPAHRRLARITPHDLLHVALHLLRHLSIKYQIPTPLLMHCQDLTATEELMDEDLVKIECQYKALDRIHLQKRRRGGEKLVLESLWDLST